MVFHRPSVVLALHILASALLLAGQSQAAELLRWKLKTDDRLKVTTNQVVETKTTYTGNSVESKLTFLIESQWLVTGVDGEVFEVSQKITRARVEMTSPKADSVVFDSADEGRAIGLARQLQSAIQPLIGPSIKVKMSSRGEVQSVELPPELTATEERAADGSAGSTTGKTATPLAASTLKALLSKPLVLLPEQEISNGENWTASEISQTPAGNVTTEKSFKLVELDQSDSSGVAKIEADGKIDIASQSKLKVTDQSCHQTVLFDIDGGMVQSSEQEVRLRTERPYRETTIAVDVTTTVKTKLERQP